MVKKLSDENVTGSIVASGDITTGGTVYVNGTSGSGGSSEGGQIELAKAPNGTTNGTSIVFDVYNDKLRFFEKDSPNRGYYLDITSAASAVGTNLAGSSGAMNASFTNATKQSNVSAAGTTLASVSLTTHGYPVLVIATGDVENNSAGGWTTLQLYRGTTAIGNIVHTEGSAASENSPFALQVIDTPAAGTYTYSLKLNGSAGGTFNFGESNGPVINIIELSGSVGPAGPQGPSGISSATAPLAYNSGTQVLSVSAASTTASGVVQLTDSTSSTSTTTAATPNSVKTAYDLAATKAPSDSPTFTGVVTASSNITFSGKGGGGGSGVTGYHLNNTGYGIFTRTAGASIYAERSTNGAAIQFYVGSSAAGTLNITTTAAPTLAAPSDYRIKTDVKPIDNALETMSKIQAYTFIKTTDPTKTVTTGFIAHELAEVQPDAVFGEKDAVDENGEMILQTVGDTRLIPLMAQSIKDLITKVEELQAEIDILKS